MKVHRWNDIRRKKLTAKQIEENDRWVEEEIVEMNLRALREFIGKTQVDVAKAADMTQPEASRAERREDHLISTLKRYVEALGGELEVFAVFDDKRIKLKGV
jgi:transcriptional regulator with XRE-family HTH domain